MTHSLLHMGPLRLVSLWLTWLAQLSNFTDHFCSISSVMQVSLQMFRYIGLKISTIKGFSQTYIIIKWSCGPIITFGSPHNCSIEDRKCSGGRLQPTPTLLLLSHPILSVLLLLFLSVAQSLLFYSICFLLFKYFNTILHLQQNLLSTTPLSEHFVFSTSVRRNFSYVLSQFHSMQSDVGFTLLMPGLHYTVRST